MEPAVPSCPTSRRRWMAWMPLVTMSLLFVAVLVYPGLLNSPWGVLLVGITAAGCPAMCLGAMPLQALAMKPASEIDGLKREPDGGSQPRR